MKSNDTLPIPLTFDVLFKSVFSKHPDILGIFLNDVLDLRLDNIEVDIKNSELVSNHINEKKDRVDIFVILNKIHCIDIELNSNYFSEIKRRNLSYLYRITNLVIEKGTSYNLMDNKKIYQLNLNAKNKKNEPLDEVATLYGLKNKKVITPNPKMILKNLDKYYKLYYNGDRRKHVVWLAMCKATTYTEVESMLTNILNTEKSKKFIKEVRFMCADDFVIHEWEKEKWDEYEKIQRYNAGLEKGEIKGIKKGRKEGLKEGIEKGRKEGIEEGKIEGLKEGIEKNISETIKKMLENNLDLNIISQISGKPVSQIKNIQKQISIKINT